MVEAGVHAAGRSQSHQVELLAGLLSVAISVDDLLVLQDVACLAGLVDLHQVLIDDTSLHRCSSVLPRSCPSVLLADRRPRRRP